MQFWFWEHVQCEGHYGVSYSPIPPPLMSRWNEENARLRFEAFKHDYLDGGMVPINI
jgi:hypothetical protein